jgi:hypothetical protein
MADWTETHERRTFAVKTQFVVERALGEIIRQWARVHLSGVVTKRRTRVPIASLDRLDPDEDATPVGDAELVLELKYSVEMPLIKDLVERFGLTPRAASKYRLRVAALGYAPELGAT